jgi:predicted peptidase
LLVFDPGGRGARAAEVFREAAERYGWIVAASENSRNGPWEPTLRAVNAMWPALLGGYAVDARRVYAAGHSGGATVAWMMARQTGQIAGVMTSGQPNPGADPGKAAAFAWFGAAGHTDFNFIEVKAIEGARVRRSLQERPQARRTRRQA